MLVELAWASLASAAWGARGSTIPGHPSIDCASNRGAPGSWFVARQWSGRTGQSTPRTLSAAAPRTTCAPPRRSFLFCFGCGVAFACKPRRSQNRKRCRTRAARSAPNRRAHALGRFFCPIQTRLGSLGSGRVPMSFYPVEAAAARRPARSSLLEQGGPTPPRAPLWAGLPLAPKPAADQKAFHAQFDRFGGRRDPGGGGGGGRLIVSLLAPEAGEGFSFRPLPLRGTPPRPLGFKPLFWGPN